MLKIIEIVLKAKADEEIQKTEKIFSVNYE